MRILRNLAYFAVGVFLAASFLLGTSSAKASHTVAHSVRQVVVPVSTTRPQTGNAAIVCTAVMLQPERAITANHCTKYETLALTINGKSYPVLESYANPDRDLAILIVPGAPCPCAYIRTTSAQLDEAIMLVGYVEGVLQTLVYGHAQGRVKEKNREQLITSASGAPGKSGGGVFDRNGYLLAIATQMGWNGYIIYAEELTPIVLKGKGSL